jgi:hypothetical protein
LESGSEITRTFLSAVLEKDGEDQLDRSCNKCRRITNSQEGEEYPTNNKKEGRLIALVTPCTELPSKT